MIEVVQRFDKTETTFATFTDGRVCVDDHGNNVLRQKNE